jgi:hypothetical protein
LLIGEFAHNARSALDYLAWQLVKANGQSPNRFTQFPIVFTPWDWHGRFGARRLRGASERHVGMVELLQPYGRPHADGFYWTSHDFLEHPLAVLSFLSNEDKHRVLLVTTAALQSIGWEIIGSRDVATITGYGNPYLGPLEDGTPLIEIPIVATGPNPELEVEFNESARITIDHRMEIKDYAVVSMQIDLLRNLEEITKELRRIFQVFVREFV